MIYVEPIYLQADVGKIPEFKRVIVAYGEAIAMEKTFEAALARVLVSERSQDAEKIVKAAAGQTVAGQKLEGRALTALRRAKKLQRTGDWTGYGKALQELEDILVEMNR